MAKKLDPYQKAMLKRQEDKMKEKHKGSDPGAGMKKEKNAQKRREDEIKRKHKESDPGVKKPKKKKKKSKK